MNHDESVPPKLRLGLIHATPGALKMIADNGQDLWDFLGRHIRGDWGNVNEDDRRANDEALLDGSRFFSAYCAQEGAKIWIITEATDDDDDRVATTILLPEEY